MVVQAKGSALFKLNKKCKRYQNQKEVEDCLREKFEDSLIYMIFEHSLCTEPTLQLLPSQGPMWNFLDCGRWYRLGKFRKSSAEYFSGQVQQQMLACVENIANARQQRRNKVTH